MTVRSSVFCLFLLFAVACAGDDIRPDESPADYAVRLAQSHDARSVVNELSRVEETLGHDYAIGEGALIGAGYWELMAGRIETAHVIQEAATIIFPESARAWDNLAEVHIYLGDRAAAEQCIERALSLDSLSDARWRVGRLDQELEAAANETDVLNAYEPGEPIGLTGPYFGQTVPGTTPEVFAPGIVSTKGGHEFSCAFTPDGREFYFNRGPNIWVSTWGADGWTAPEVASFNSNRLDHEPFIPTDGSRLFFGSGREREGVSPDEAYGIWVMDREGDGWGEPEYLFGGMFVTTATSGNAYVTDVFRTVGGGLCVYRWEDGSYQDCERLVGGVNDRDVAHPLIAPDETFLISDGDDDLFISFPLSGGGWSEGVRVDEISDVGEIMTAAFSPDGEYLFFYANHDIYWVNVDVLYPYVEEAYYRER